MKGSVSIISVYRGGVPEWLKGADCKSVGLRLRWFESNPLHHFRGLQPIVAEKAVMSAGGAQWESSGVRRLGGGFDSLRPLQSVGKALSAKLPMWLSGRALPW